MTRICTIALRNDVDVHLVLVRSRDCDEFAFFLEDDLVTNLQVLEL
jgi:hypothetical protein